MCNRVVLKLSRATVNETSVEIRYDSVLTAKRKLRVEQIQLKCMDLDMYGSYGQRIRLD